MKLRLKVSFGMVPTGAQASRLQRREAASSPPATANESEADSPRASETLALQSYRVIGQLHEAAEKGFYHSPGWNKDYSHLQT